MKALILFVLAAASFTASAAERISVYEERNFRSNADIIVYEEPNFKSNADVVVGGTRDLVLAAAACVR